MKVLGFSLLLAGAATCAFASYTPVAAPEIDGSSAVSALFLLSGGLLILRTRHKK